MAAYKVFDPVNSQSSNLGGQRGLGVDSRPKALVIGSGFGGLASAIRLRTRGYSVEVLEKLDAPGGRAYVHRQDGFTFDAGPTIITAPELLEELWQLCGKKMSDHIDLRLMTPFYRIQFSDGKCFDYCGDTESMCREVAKFSPSDVRGYKNLMRDANLCYELGFKEMADISFTSLMDLIKVIPKFTRMGAWRSIYSLVSKHIKNPQLRVVFSFHPLLIGGNPFSVTSAYSLIHALEKKGGVHSAMGGTGAIVQGLVKLLKGLNVPIHFNSEVKEIRIADKKVLGVTLVNGLQMNADIVVSNADSAWTYKHLIASQHRKHWTDQKIENGKYSMGLFVWYFGVNRQYPDIPHHMMLLGDRYRGLLSDIFKSHTLAKDFSLYLHRPTATDPSLAPEGCDTFYVLSPVPHLDAGIDWRIQAESYRQSIERALEKTLLPGLSASVISSKVTTPLDFQNRLNSYKGAGFGLEPVLTQSAYFRPHNQSEDIDGLFMVGASTHPGAGVPGVLMSAKALQTVIPDAQIFAHPV
jgi:phytoene desaturase